MNVTAIVLTNRPYLRQWPGLTVLAHQAGTFQTSADHRRAWNEAIVRVDTEHFCFIDDDDELPTDYLSVIEECIAENKPLAYTDEVLRFSDGGESLHRGQAYSQAAHLANPMLVHHLAVCRTRDAQAALAELPIGKFWPEMLLYWQLAKAGAAYVHRVGYVWNVAAQGLHTEPFVHIAQTRSALWCRANP